MKKHFHYLFVSLVLLTGCNSAAPQTNNKTIVTSYSTDATSLYKQVIGAIYIVEVYDKETKAWRFTATAFAASYKGKTYILTAKHVVDDEEKYRLKIDKSSYDIESSDLDPIEGEDIAIIHIKDWNPKVTIPLASKDPEIGSVCYAFGHPLEFYNAITDGIVSQFDRSDGNIIATAHIAPGSSGGALVNSKGQLIGIISKTIIQFNSLNFFVPVSQIIKYLDSK